MDVMARIEVRRILWLELMDEPPVPDHALAQGHVEIAGHFVDEHEAGEVTTFPIFHAKEGILPFLDALLCFLPDILRGPTLDRVLGCDLVPRPRW